MSGDEELESFDDDFDFEEDFDPLRLHVCSNQNNNKRHKLATNKLRYKQ